MMVQGTSIEIVKNIKILGITIEFNEHINDTCKKASQRIGVLMRLRNIVSTTANLHARLISRSSSLSYTVILLGIFAKLLIGEN